MKFLTFLGKAKEVKYEITDMQSTIAFDLPAPHSAEIRS